MTISYSFTYILTNKNKTVLYVGVTTDLVGRMHEHKTKLNPDSFTARYNVDHLVYFEQIDGIENAIDREKQIKGWSREKKLNLIHQHNPEMIDLYERILVEL